MRFSGVKISFFFGIILISILIYGNVFSYDEEVAHPFLTRNAINLFDQISENKISEQEGEWIIQGAIEEDAFLRWMNHFYNPVNGLGIFGFQSAKEWAQNGLEQNIYPEGNNSWQKAIDSYARGDKKEAFIALGHIIHLIEDMAVPAHTRSDDHATGDLYEIWVKKNSQKNFDDVSLVNFNTLGEYFDNMAGYSNKYFSSEDTIYTPDLNNKDQFIKITELGNFRCIKGEFNHCLVLVKKELGKDKYFFDSLVHSDYYSLLAPKAISYGAGVIDLFFKEAEKEKQKLQEKSFFEKLKDLFLNSNTSPSSQVAGPGFLLVNDVEHSVFNINTAVEPEPEPTPGVGSEQSPEQIPAVSQIQHMRDLTDEQDESGESGGPQLPTPGVGNTPGVIEPKFSLSGAPYAGFGGGVPNQEQSSDTGQGGASSQPPAEPEPEPEPEIPVDTTPPDISLSVSECANSLTTDSCLLATTTLHISWQSVASDLDYYEFSHSINSGQAQVSTTTATSTTVIVSDNSTNNFSVRAVDKTGNWSAPQATMVTVSSMPVVINEVAWAGTGAGYPNDEWIELYNRTSSAINLENWILYSQTDMGPYINLSGSISANGYYLVERTDDDTLSDIAADWFGSFGNGLSNAEEILSLSRASTTIDQTVLCGSGPVKWCPGFDYKYKTMERKNPALPGTDSTNWSYNNELVKNGKDAAGQAIYGTPKTRNSANYLIANGASSISSDVTLTKVNSPYVVNNVRQAFQDNATLTIEPGVVIKFYNDAGFYFSGNSKIIAQGTASEPIIFTSFNDDTYGGDLDNASSTPYAGGWFGVDINTTNNDSVFDHIIFRYGGKYYTSGDYGRADLRVQSSSASISNSVFESSLVYGIKLVSSNSNVSDNVIKNNNDSAIYISSGNPTISGNTMEQNSRGIYITGSSATINSNTFNSNTNEAISSVYMCSFFGNSGSGNGTNGITLTGGSSGITRVDETASVKSNPLPYIFNAPSRVVTSSTLVVESGAILKAGGGSSFGGRLDVYGNLLVQGNSSGDIIFTSSYSLPSVGDWQGIRMYAGSYSDIKGTTITYAGKGIVYESSPVNLESVKFENNNLAIQADTGSLLDGAIIATLEFLGNVANTTPAGLLGL